jgi:hypothetical protein
MVRTRLIRGICIISLMLLLAGCTIQQSANGTNEGKKSENGPKKNGQASLFEKMKLPIPIQSGRFVGVMGWLDDKTIVYLAETDGSSILYKYNLFSGKSIKLFASDAPVVSVKVSPSGKRLLVHYSPSDNQGTITVMDQAGKPLSTKTIVSSEISYVWNPYNEDLVLVTAFDEQWNFHVSILNIKTNELANSLLKKQPFAEWLTGKEFIYLDWDINEPALFAPVARQKMSETKVEYIQLKNVFQLFAFQDVFLILSVADGKQEKAVYTFYTNRFKRLQTFSIPQLANLSDWLVPNHDFVRKSNQFLTFRPLSSGDADTYNKGFQLVRYSLDGKKEEVLLEAMENKPIDCSPNGRLCLYGYQLENMIDLDAKKVVPLAKK